MIIDKGDYNMFCNRPFGRRPCQPMMGSSCSPIVEPTTTTCVECEFFHEVPHD